MSLLGALWHFILMAYNSPGSEVCG
jgi:hypothetical protein